MFKLLILTPGAALCGLILGLATVIIIVGILALACVALLPGDSFKPKK